MPLHSMRAGSFAETSAFCKLKGPQRVASSPSIGSALRSLQFELMATNGHFERLESPAEDRSFETATNSYWSTSSARSSSDFGIVSPSAFATLRLITNSIGRLLHG